MTTDAFWEINRLWSTQRMSMALLDWNRQGSCGKAFVIEGCRLSSPFVAPVDRIYFKAVDEHWNWVLAWPYRSVFSVFASPAASPVLLGQEDPITLCPTVS